MSDYYSQFLASMSAIGTTPGMSPQDMQPPPFPEAQLPMAGAMPHGYPNMGYFSGYAEPVQYAAPRPQKNRRKGGPGHEHVKHKRTRSGCFTCRSRRVKCDEARPVCERCKKGNRECIYPDPPNSKGTSSQNQGSKDSQHPSPGSSHGTEDVEDDNEREKKLETIPDEDEGPFDSVDRHRGHVSSSAASPINPLQHSSRHASETPSHEGYRSSPAASTETSNSQTPMAGQINPYHPDLSPNPRPDWSSFSQDVQHYMRHFYDVITHHHYCIFNDGEDFFHSVLPYFASRNEALLNALVGFSAYHYTLEKRPDGKIQEFLKYYNRSVTLLLGSLKASDQPDIATLLTILQLATVEEFLGDWINLMGHQKAAYEILTKLFTPQTAMQSTLGRMVVHWYSRFDIFVGIMGGFPTTLPRPWFAEFADYCDSRVKSPTIKEEAGSRTNSAAPSPSSGNTPSMRLHWKFEKELAVFRLISRDMSMLFARGSRGQISQQDFASEHDALLKRLVDWKASWDPELVDKSYLVTDFSWAPEPTAEDIVQPYKPGVLYQLPRFGATALNLQWLSMMIMHKCQSPKMPGMELFMEMAGHALQVCEIFELIEHWPESPRGSLMAVQAPLGISALFVPQDQKHHMWFRRKLALLEMKGFIFPSTLRVKMGELFRDPTVARWWLPNDEYYTPILKAVRNLADERNAAAMNAQQESLAEVRHIFAKMALSDQGGGGAQ